MAGSLSSREAYRNYIGTTLEVTLREHCCASNGTVTTLRLLQTVRRFIIAINIIIIIIIITIIITIHHHLYLSD
jgi:hypothetical protein